MSHETKKQPSRTGYNVADWYYTVRDMPQGVDLYNSKERAAWLSNLTTQILKSLQGFATPKGVDIETVMSGEDGLIWKSPSEKDFLDINHYLESTFDVTGVTIWFDIECVMTQLNSQTNTVMSGWDGWIYISNSIVQGELVDPGYSLVDVHFEFHNFIFSPQVLSDEYLSCAELNAAPLQDFIHRLDRISALQFHEANYPDEYVHWLISNQFDDGHGLRSHKVLADRDPA